MKGLRVIESWYRLARSTGVLQARRPLCTNTNNGKAIKTEKSIRDFDAYRQLDKLDFKSAAQILFMHPPKKKKFGIDFHLVQLFFVCMPSLAVYLVAQYARHEIKRMEAEVEVKKKKAEEEDKAKELEAKALKENEEAESNPELYNVKVRLNVLEEALKEIAVEGKKVSSSKITKDQEGHKGQNLEPVRSNSERKSNDSSTEANEQQSKKQLSESIPDSSHESIAGSGSKR